MQITSADLAQIIPALQQNSAQSRRFLNIGSGVANRERLPECFRDQRWQEVRLDIDPKVRPDILGDASDLSKIADGSFDAIYSSHNLEHLEGFAVPGALKEMHRVLKRGGFVIITLPNLERIAQLILENKMTQTLYTSPAGPINTLDMLFGHQKAIEKGNEFMAHRTGFTSAHLQDLLHQAGFSEIRIRKGDSFDLWAIASK